MERIKIKDLTLDKIASICDHTFLNRSEQYKGKTQESPVRARKQAYEQFIERTLALTSSPYAVCVRPEDVRRTNSNLRGRDIKIASVVGFPDGSLYHPSFKVAETRLALEDGAIEIDMVLNYAALNAGGLDYVQNDIGLVAQETHNASALLKLILETSELTPFQIAQACQIAKDLSVDFVKTSTGFGSYGARPEDLKIMRENFPGGIKISGGVRPDNYQSLLEAAVGSEWIDLDPLKIRIGESGLLI